MSYLSRIVYTPTTTTAGPFTVSFPYISQDHVKVYLNGIASTDFTWPTSSSILLDDAVTAGTIVLIKRETPSDERLVEFQEDALTKSSDFNLEGDHGFYLAQEALDEVTNDILKTNGTLNWDADNKTIQNLAAPINPTDAATKAYADGGNLEACSEQAQIATEQAGIATAATGFPVSAFLGGSSDYSLTSGSNIVLARFAVEIPTGKNLKLKKAKYSFNDTAALLQVDSEDETWLSDSSEGEEAVNVTIATGGSTKVISIRATNPVVGYTTPISNFDGGVVHFTIE